MYNREDFIKSIKSYYNMGRIERNYFLTDVDRLFDDIEESRKTQLLNMHNLPDKDLDEEYIRLYKENYTLKLALADKDETITQLERMLKLISEHVDGEDKWTR